MMDGAGAPCRLIKGFATPAEIDALTRLIKAHDSLFKETSGKGRLGPRYRIIQGEEIRRELREISLFGAQRVRPAVEQFAERPLAESGLIAETRVQAFDRSDHDFRWHFDTHPYSGLLTLWNENNSETQVVSPRLSRALRFVLYPLYPFPAIFNRVPIAATRWRPEICWSCTARRCCIVAWHCHNRAAGSSSPTASSNRTVN